MGGGQPEDTSARNPRVAGQHPQPSPRGHVVIFLPALNEERAIGHVLQRIPKAQLEAAGYTVSVWVVDGNSTDRTLEVIRKSGASVFVQTGRGKGNGMRQAFDHLLRSRDRADGGSREPEFYFMFDADGNPRRDLNYYGDLLVNHCWVVIDDYSGPGMKAAPIRAQVDEMVSAGKLVPFGYYGWSTWIGQWQRK